MLLGHCEIGKCTLREKGEEGREGGGVNCIALGLNQLIVSEVPA